MPGFYPRQSECEDNAADAALRARARKLADDIGARHATIDASAVSRLDARALAARLVERLPYAVTALRSAADKYPDPIPRPFSHYVAELGDADRAFVEQHQVVVDGLGGIVMRLEQLNRDWPCFDGMVVRQLRAEDEADKPGAAAVLKAVQASGVSDGGFV
jgi:hypothetical protein